MNWKAISSTILILLLYFSYASSDLNELEALNTGSVRNIDTGLSYEKIQEAINADQTKDGHTLLVSEGVYYENIVVEKSLSLIGDGKCTTIIEGNQTSVTLRVTAPDVTIEGFTVRNGNTGIYVDRSNNSIIRKNNVNSNVDAIIARFSHNITIQHNSAENNSHRGILITNSWNFTVKNNVVYNHSWYGINSNASANGIIKQNIVHENYYDGIGLFKSANCTVAENNVVSNTIFGILLDSSHDIHVYHNNFINNGYQARKTNAAADYWDNGLEGNYWSDYNGTDHDTDGIGDTVYTFDEVTDNFPLMGIFRSFNTSLNLRVNVISNSTITGFTYFDFNNTMKMYASNTTNTQTHGFCRISIPHALMSETYYVIVNGTEPFHVNYTLYDDDISRWIYFSYEHSTLEIIIVPEPTLLTILTFLLTTTLLVAIKHKNKKGGLWFEPAEVAAGWSQVFDVNFAVAVNVVYVGNCYDSVS